MDAQKLFDKFAHELLGEGKATLTEYADFTTVLFKHDAFRHSHQKALHYIIVDLELTPKHLLTDVRKQLLIDLQLVSRWAPSSWADGLRDLASQYKLRWTQDFFVPLQKDKEKQGENK